MARISAQLLAIQLLLQAADAATTGLAGSGQTPQRLLLRTGRRDAGGSNSAESRRRRRGAAASTADTYDISKTVAEVLEAARETSSEEGKASSVSHKHHSAESRRRRRGAVAETVEVPDVSRIAEEVSEETATEKSTDEGKASSVSHKHHSAESRRRRRGAVAETVEVPDVSRTVEVSEEATPEKSSEDIEAPTVTHKHRSSESRRRRRGLESNLSQAAAPEEWPAMPAGVNAFSPWEVNMPTQSSSHRHQTFSEDASPSQLTEAKAEEHEGPGPAKVSTRTTATLEDAVTDNVKAEDTQRLMMKPYTPAHQEASTASHDVKSDVPLRYKAVPDHFTMPAGLPGEGLPIIPGGALPIGFHKPQGAGPPEQEQAAVVPSAASTVQYSIDGQAGMPGMPVSVPSENDGMVSSSVLPSAGGSIDGQRGLIDAQLATQENVLMHAPSAAVLTRPSSATPAASTWTPQLINAVASSPSLLQRINVLGTQKRPGLAQRNLRASRKIAMLQQSAPPLQQAPLVATPTLTPEDILPLYRVKNDDPVVRTITEGTGMAQAPEVTRWIEVLSNVSAASNNSDDPYYHYSVNADSGRWITTERRERLKAGDMAKSDHEWLAQLRMWNLQPPNSDTGKDMYKQLMPYTWLSNTTLWDELKSLPPEMPMDWPTQMPLPAATFTPPPDIASYPAGLAPDGYYKSKIILREQRSGAP